MNCPDFERLMVYLDGELPAEETSRLVEHLETCPDCRMILDSQRAVEAAWREDFRYPSESAFRECENRIGARLGRRSRWRTVLPVAAAITAVFLGVKLVLFSGPGFEKRLPDPAAPTEAVEYDPSTGSYGRSYGAGSEEEETESTMVPEELEGVTRDERADLPQDPDDLQPDETPAVTDQVSTAETHFSMDEETAGLGGVSAQSSFPATGVLSGGVVSGIEGVSDLHSATGGASGPEASPGLTGLNPASDGESTSQYQSEPGMGGGGGASSESVSSVEQGMEEHEWEQAAGNAGESGGTQVGFAAGGAAATTDTESVYLEGAPLTTACVEEAEEADEAPMEETGEEEEYIPEYPGSFGGDVSADVDTMLESEDATSVNSAADDRNACPEPLRSSEFVTLVFDTKGHPDSLTVIHLDSLFPDWRMYIPFAFRDTVLIVPVDEAITLITAWEPDSLAQ